MDRFDSRTSVLLVAVLVVLATVPVGAPHAGGPDAAPTDAFRSASESVDGGSLVQETPDETTTPDEESAGNHTAEPLALPDRPDPLNDSSAVRYVAAYEQVRKHNEILEETTDVSITDVRAFCSPTSLHEQADGFAVEVSCGFSYEFGENGTSTGIADGAPYVARYLVDENATELRGLWPAIGTGGADPLPVPTGPESMTSTSVAIYAAGYEEVRKYNELLSATNATVTRADVFCEPERVAERDDDFVVDVSCDFSYGFRTEDGAIGVADGPPYTARYRVDETATELVRAESVGGNATTSTGAETTVPVEDGTTTPTAT